MAGLPVGNTPLSFQGWEPPSPTTAGQWISHYNRGLYILAFVCHAYPALFVPLNSKRLFVGFGFCFYVSFFSVRTDPYVRGWDVSTRTNRNCHIVTKKTQTEPIAGRRREHRWRHYCRVGMGEQGEARPAKPSERWTSSRSYPPCTDELSMWKPNREPRQRRDPPRSITPIYGSRPWYVKTTHTVVVSILSIDSMSITGAWYHIRLHTCTKYYVRRIQEWGNI